MAFTAGVPQVNNLSTAGGSLRIAVAQATGPASYATGGDPLTPSTVGLSSVAAAWVVPTNSIAGVGQLRYNAATGKVQAWSATPGTEVTAGTNLSALQFQLIAIGA